MPFLLIHPACPRMDPIARQQCIRPNITFVRGSQVSLGEIMSPRA